ncbi:MAG TPA: hydantoinase/oxoprolinase family protein [Gemmatimonadaceae bacterium]|nr:hydantoinase/oxoprolinase family protein [Gemmatimonadaceae bacterium]
MSAASVGIDVGGTFTDLVSVDADGSVVARKVLSTPRDQSDGVIAALRALGGSPGDISRLIHGTTVATNALLERSGATVALCATAGFEDVLELRRQDRAALYDLARHHPPPLVPRDRCIGVPERMGPAGVLVALDPADAQDVARAVAALGVRAVAVSLLHAYRDPRHERCLEQALRAACPEVDVVLGSDVLPEIREYERTATTVAEAYLRPVVSLYLGQLAKRVGGAGYPAPAVMTSSGGVLPAAEAAHNAAALALSGPAGGVVGAALVASLAGFDRALTIDIGGTSADAGLVLDGVPLVESGGDIAGVPIALPRVLVETVSAGGGSVGWLDDGGALRVGPRSAGAEPGPAAFGLGGVEPTVTDAHFVLGTVRQRVLSGGVVADRAAAYAAVARLASSLGATPERVAAAMIAAADASVARALRRVSVERGVDPRGCVLVAFGGGGGLHACGLAEQLGMRKVLVPPLAGVLSALGLAVAAERRDALVSVMRHADDLSPDEISAACAALAERAGAAPSRAWWARARYAGQGHELDVPLQPGEGGPAAGARFARVHAVRYGFTLELPVEIVGLRHAALGQPVPVTIARRGSQPWSPDEPQDSGGMLDVTVHGPSTIALPDATMVIARGWTGRSLPIGGWLLERDT